MKSTRLRILIGSLIPTIAMLALAAPMLPGKSPPPPDEVLSTANVKRVRLEILPQPRAIHAAGLSETKLAESLIPIFQRSGIEVVKDDTAPLARVQTLLMVDPKTPDAISVLCFLEFHQRATLPRLDNRELFVPTVTLLNPSPATRETLPAVTQSLLEGVVKQFTDSVARATASIAG